MDIKQYMQGLGQLARASAGLMARATTAQKNNALIAIAENIQKHRAVLTKANAEDLTLAKEKNLESALLDRLELTDSTYQ